MGCGCFRCNCCCTKKENSDRKSLNSSDNDIIMIDRHYSCSESGALVALIITLVLILGAIASTIFIKNNNLVLICSVVSLVIAFAILFAYCTWQRMNVRRQRARYGRPFTADISHRVNGHLYTSVPTSTSTRTSWLFWSTEKNSMQNSPNQRQVPAPPAELNTKPKFINAQSSQRPQQMAGIQQASYSTVV